VTRKNKCRKIKEAINQMDYQGDPVNYFPYGNGHINDTFVVVCKTNKGTEIKYLLQRMNHEIFAEPDKLMENICGVTEFLRKKIIDIGGDPQRETLNVIPTRSGGSFYKDSIGSYWRSYLFIDNTICFEKVEAVEDFYKSAVAFGNFQRLLSDYPAHTLHESIKNFHNTRIRLDNLIKAVSEDILNRAKDVQDEIGFAFSRADDASILVDLQSEGKLPLRVTHNDTKLNNILFDNKTRNPVCIIDLDTVMPGLAVNDFGDSIRFGANTGAEDEKDLSKISLDIKLFEAYTKGFLEGCAGSLTGLETEMLPMAAKLMTFECGIRFLTDYLQGDTYFKIHRKGQNLDRCRTQFKLVEDMESKWQIMQEIVNRYSQKSPV
jgi:hypothetical protein